MKFHLGRYHREIQAAVSLLQDKEIPCPAELKKTPSSENSRPK